METLVAHPSLLDIIDNLCESVIKDKNHNIVFKTKSDSMLPPVKLTFPEDRFIEYEPKDAAWAVPLGLAKVEGEVVWYEVNSNYLEPGPVPITIGRNFEDEYFQSHFSLG
ncbi:MAG: hypothetical protein DWQ19_10200 [Crenarchaeota archaeon]|nr:MAG: hypothetical protein DWQ19_10200 [Thermoproteota archaeon]